MNVFLIFLIWKIQLFLFKLTNLQQQSQNFMFYNSLRKFYNGKNYTKKLKKIRHYYEQSKRKKKCCEEVDVISYLSLYQICLILGTPILDMFKLLYKYWMSFWRFWFEKCNNYYNLSLQTCNSKMKILCLKFLLEILSKIIKIV